MTTISGSITLKRLKKGGNVIVSIKTEGAALYQGWNDKSGAAVPSFKTAANQPVLVPSAVASNNQPASITNGNWYYNDTLLVPSSTSLTDGFYKCTDARFAFNPSNYKLKIIDDIASAGNTSNDILTFKCSGEAGGVSYSTEASAEIHLQIVGSSAAAVYIEGDCTLTTSTPNVTLKAHFFIDGDEPTGGYTFKWYKEDGTEVKGANGSTCVVTRDDVTAIGGVYCSVYRNGETKSALATDFHKMTDINDELELYATVNQDYYYDEATGQEQKQTITAHICQMVNGKAGEEVTNPTGTFSHTFKSASTNVTLATKTGKVVENIGQDIWGQITGENEDVIDFITYKY